MRFLLLYIKGTAGLLIFLSTFASVAAAFHHPYDYDELFFARGAEDEEPILLDGVARARVPLMLRIHALRPQRQATSSRFVLSVVAIILAFRMEALGSTRDAMCPAKYRKSINHEANTCLYTLRIHVAAELKLIIVIRDHFPSHLV